MIHNPCKFPANLPSALRRNNRIRQSARDHIYISVRFVVETEQRLRNPQVVPEIDVPVQSDKRSMRLYTRGMPVSVRPSACASGFPFSMRPHGQATPLEKAHLPQGYKGSSVAVALRGSRKGHLPTLQTHRISPRLSQCVPRRRIPRESGLPTQRATPKSVN